MKRFKPDPIPAIRPVAEHMATGSLKEVYEQTKTTLGVPWMGVVAMAFAHYPNFYKALWEAFAPVVQTVEFAAACQRLQGVAEAQASTLAPPPICQRLNAQGYQAREIDEIRACNGVFSSGNMPYLLLATRARLALEGEDWPDSPMTPAPRPVSDFSPLVLMEPHHAEAETATIYRDVRDRLGLPFVNTDYRAFARWPSYFALAWSDLAPHVGTPAYQMALETVHAAAIAGAQSLGNPTGLKAEALQNAAAMDAPMTEVRDVVRLFQWLLPGLAVNVGFFRAQLSG